MHSMPDYNDGGGRAGPPGFGRASSLRNLGSPQTTQPMSPPPRSWTKSPSYVPMERRAVSLHTGNATVHSQMDRAIAQEEGWDLEFGTVNAKAKEPVVKKEVADVLAELSLSDAICDVDRSESDRHMPIPSPKAARTPSMVESPPSPGTNASPLAVKAETPTQSHQQQQQTRTSPTPPPVPLSAGPTPFAAMGASLPPPSPGRGSTAANPTSTTTSSLNHLATPFSANAAANDHIFGTPTARSSSFSMQRALTEIPESSFLTQPVSPLRIVNDLINLINAEFSGEDRKSDVG